jgi:hypothetical protein
MAQNYTYRALMYDRRKAYPDPREPFFIYQVQEPDDERFYLRAWEDNEKEHVTIVTVHRYR